MLHQCDLLAIRVGEVLRGTSERIAAGSSPFRRTCSGFIERTAEENEGEKLVALERQVASSRRRRSS